MRKLGFERLKPLAMLRWLMAELGFILNLFFFTYKNKFPEVGLAGI